MNIQVQARHGSLSEATREKMAAKLSKFERFEELISYVDVVVELEKQDRPAVEIVLATKVKHVFRANYSSNELFGAMDQAIDKLAQQMRRFKEKLTDYTIKEAPAAAVEV